MSRSDQLSKDWADLVWKHLSTARWYAGKGRPATLQALTALPTLGGVSAEAGPVLRCLIAEVAHSDDGSTHFYLVPLLLRGPDLPGTPQTALGALSDPELGEVVVHDATADPFAQQLFLSVLLGAGEVSSEDGSARVSARLTAAAQDPASGVRAGLAPRRFGGEQSNTSIMFADVAMLKLFRRLEPGDNLDIEVHRALGEGPAADDVATLFGWLAADWTDSFGEQRHADLGMLVEQLREVRDGWDVAVDSAAAAGVAAASGDAGDFTAEAYSLGRSLAQVHTALAEAFGTSERPADEVTRAMTARLEQAAQVVPELVEDLPDLQRRFTMLGDRLLTTQRIHGDFHLGQTLRRADAQGRPSWTIIDFEGEPLNSLAERREADSAWRDVAGMLRSIDYAAAFATRERGADPERARQWAEQTSEAFLAGYAQQVSPEQLQLVAAYQVDKAGYEAVYEARNRPDWLPIPLEALRRLARPASGSDANDAQTNQTNPDLANHDLGGRDD